MQGAQVKSYTITNRGNTSVTIDGYTLEAGMYLYTLIADGKEVDTKKMISANGFIGQNIASVKDLVNTDCYLCAINRGAYLPLCKF